MEEVTQPEQSPSKTSQSKWEKGLKCKRNLNTNIMVDYQIPVQQHFANYFAYCFSAEILLNGYKSILHQQKRKEGQSHHSSQLCFSSAVLFHSCRLPSHEFNYFNIAFSIMTRNSQLLVMIIPLGCF